jgi:hypothetical protein
MTAMSDTVKKISPGCNSFYQVDAAKIDEVVRHQDQISGNGVGGDLGVARTSQADP